MNLEIFKNENFEIRVAVDENNEPLFCLADVCKALGLTTPAKVANSIKSEFDGDELNSYPFQTNGGIQNFTMITEPQLYFVLMRSDKPNAKPFRMFVNKEVLPSIRKTGSYTQKPLTQAEILAQSAALLVEHERRTAALEAETEAIRKNQLKIANCVNRLTNSNENLTVIAYGILNKVRLDKNKASSLGRKASKLSRERNLTIGRWRDPHWGEVGLYDISVLEQVFKDAGLTNKGAQNVAL
nr:MAG TPA: repressor domain protein [Caudoviricetes sp.]